MWNLIILIGSRMSSLSRFMQCYFIIYANMFKKETFCDYIFLAIDFVDDNVVTIIGPFSSLGVKAANPVCAGLRIPYIASLATDPTLTAKDFPYIARVSLYRKELLSSEKIIQNGCSMFDADKC